MTKYESLRTDPAHWSLGLIYYCRQDPRLVVRNLAPVGWTWNFAHAFVYPAILLAIVIFLGPVWLAWSLGLDSVLAFALLILVDLSLLMLLARQLAREPKSETLHDS